MHLNALYILRDLKMAKCCSILGTVVGTLILVAGVAAIVIFVVLPIFSANNPTGATTSSTTLDQKPIPTNPKPSLTTNELPTTNNSTSESPTSTDYSKTTNNITIELPTTTVDTLTTNNNTNESPTTTDNSLTTNNSTSESSTNSF